MQRLKQVRWRRSDIAAHEKRTQIDRDVIVTEPIELKALDLAIRKNPDPHARLERCDTCFGALCQVVSKLGSPFVIRHETLREADLQLLREFLPGCRRGRGGAIGGVLSRRD